MRLLVVSATEHEIKPLLQYKELNEVGRSNQSSTLDSFSTLVTGPGMVSTVFHLSKYLSAHKIDLVINVGIAGAFDDRIPKGTVMNVIKDTFADFGAEQADGRFQTVFEMGLINQNASPFSNGWIYPLKSGFLLDDLPQVSSITVNKVTGHQSSIQSIQTKYEPDLESMEGAAVFYVCNMMSVPSIQIRSVSNHVEPRNRANWEIPLAIKNLNAYLLHFLSVIKH